MIRHELNDVERLIIQYCYEPRGRAEIAGHLGLKDRKYLSSRIRHLIELGILQMTLPDRPTSTKQKYVIVKNKGLVEV